MPRYPKADPGGPNGNESVFVLAEPMYGEPPVEA